MLSGLGVRLEERLYAAFFPERKVQQRIKGVSFCGFLGGIVTNLDLSTAVSLGRLVSHGFGQVEPC
jgi:hypothetical protein